MLSSAIIRQKEADVERVLKKVFGIAYLAAVFLLPLAFYGGHDDPFWGTQKAFLKITAFTLILIYAAVVFFSREIVFVKTGLNLPAAVFFCAVLAGAAVSVNKYAWLDKAACLLALFTFFYGALFFSYLDKNSVKKITTAALASALISAIYGIMQTAGIDFVSYQTTFGGRAASTFGNPNFLAGHMILVIPICAALAAGADSKIGKAGFGLLALVTALAMLFTQTRGAYIGFGVSVLVVALLFGRDREKRKPAIAVVVTAVLCAALYLGLSDGAMKRVTDFVGGRDDAGAIRFSLWKNALYMVKEMPLLGTGAGNFRIIYPYYQSRSMKPEMYQSTDIYKSAHTHNDYIQFSAEYGLIGAGAFFVFVFLPAVYLVVIRRRHGALEIGAAAGMTAVAVHALFNFPFMIYPTAALFFTLNGVICGRSGFVGFGEIKNRIPTAAASCVAAAAAIAVVISSAADFTAGAYLRKAKESEHFKKYEQAAAHAGRAAQIAPNDDNTLYQAAMILVNAGMQGKAEGLIERAHRLNPGHWEANINYYNISQFRGNVEEAEKTAVNMYRISPYSLKAALSLGYAYFMSNKPMQAVHIYEAARAIRPDNFEITHHLSAAYGAAGVHDKAVKYAEAALEMNPSFEGAYYNLAVAYFKKGEIPQAITSIKRGLAAFPDSAALKNLLKAVKNESGR